MEIFYKENMERIKENQKRQNKKLWGNCQKV